VQSTPRTSKDSACVDVWLPETPETATNISVECANIIRENADDVKLAARGVARLYALGNSGSAIRLAPEIVLSNKHVVDVMAKPLVSFEDFITRQESNICQVTSQVYGFQDFYSRLGNRFKLDHMSGITGNFTDIDLAALYISNAPTDYKVIFVPSSTPMQPNEGMITISFPGDQDDPPERFATTGGPEYRNYAGDFRNIKEAFFGFERRTASFGKVLHTYHTTHERWEQKLSDAHSIQDEITIYSNESLFAGSSGGATIRTNPKIESVEVSGETWTFVELNGCRKCSLSLLILIDFGGEFVACSKCLELLPANRSLVNQLSYLIDFCSDCKKRALNECLSYNYAISVHHPIFAQFYCTKIVPALIEKFGEKLPAMVKNYMEAHPESIREHGRHLNVCSYCGTMLGTGGFRCSACKTAYYCSKTCQTNDWKPMYHKKQCKNKF
jgi:hypothetical protein